MDQFSSLFGEENSFLCIDCQNLSHQIISIASPAPSIVLCDSGVKHELVEGEYKKRRQQCESAVLSLGNRLSRSVKNLRDITPLDLVDNEDILNSVERLRARHVVYENQRVLGGVEALQANDLPRLGQLMRESRLVS